MNPTEQIVLERWIEHRDPDAFRSLAVQYSGMVYGTCRRILGDATEAEDVAQECFEALACVKRSPGTYLGPWLHRVATNLSIKRVRSDVRRKRREQDYAREHAAPEDIVWDDVYTYVDEAILSLPDRYRIPVVAHFLDNQTHAAIAEALHVPRQTVSYRIGRGVEAIRKSLKRRGVSIAIPALAAMLGANLAAEAAPTTLAATLGKIALAGVNGGKAASLNAAIAAASKGAVHVSAQALAYAGAALVIVAGVVSYAFLRDYLATPDKGLQPLASTPGPAVVGQAGVIQDGQPHRATGETADAEQWVEGTENGPGSMHGLAFDGDINHRLLESLKLTVERMDWDLSEMTPAARWFREVTTGPQGIIKVSDLPSGTYVVHGARGDMAGADWAIIDPWDPEAALVVVFKPTASIDGSVHDPEGRPVAGAVVYPYEKVEGWDRNKTISRAYFAAILRARTAQDGSFHIARVDCGTVQLAAKAPGYALCISDPVSVPGEPVQMTLRRGETARGQVVEGATGRPVEGIRLLVMGLVLQEWFRPVTDAQGQFALRDLRPARYMARVFDQQYVGLEGDIPFEVKEGEAASIPVVQVARGGAIEGRMRDADTGAGIAGVPIVLTESGRGSVTGPVLSDNAGAYVIPGTLMDGFCTLRVEPVSGYRMANHMREIRVDIRDRTRVKHLDFALSKRYAIAGTVVDAGGRPVADAAVEAFGGSDEGSQETKSGLDGHFALDGFSRGCPAFVAARTERMASPRLGPLDAASGQLGSVTLSLGLAAGLEGTVLDLRKRPLNGWEVKAVATNPPEAEYGPTAADAQGRFKLTNLIAGEYALLVAPPGSAFRADRELLRVSLAEGQVLHGLVLQEDRGLSISGHVGESSTLEGASGKDAVEATVECFGPVTSRAVTDEEGHYVLLGLAEGAYALRVANKERTCCTASIEDVAAGSVHVDFILRPRAVVKGRAIRKDDGQPVTGYEVGFIPGRVAEIPAQSLANRRYDFMRVQDPDGMFELKGVEAGQDTLIVSAPGFATAFVTLDNVPKGGTLSDIEIALQPGGGVAGSVSDEEGNPVSDAMIFVGELPEPGYRQAAVAARTRADGRFSLQNVPDHPTTLFCLCKGYAPASTALDVTQSSEVEITLSHGATLEGVVRLAGEPLPHQVVRIDKGLQPLVSGLQPLVSDMYTRTDWSGTYRFENLPPGTVWIEAQLWETGGSSARPVRSLTRVMDLAAGKSVVADFDFPAAEAAIQGTVTLHGAPVADALLELHRETPEGREDLQIALLSDGSFIADQVPSGPATLIARAWNDDGQEYKVVRHVQLPSGEALQLDIELSPSGPRP